MCDSPLLAYYTGAFNPETNKPRIRFIPKRVEFSYEDYKKKYGDRLLLLPCGHCPSCLKSYSYDWMVRLMAESLYHEHKCFLTLTYDPEHLPEKTYRSDDDGVLHLSWLVKKDLQDFFKRLRKEFSDTKIRYFACGEYGDHPPEGQSVGRPHYHVILFGLDFDDKYLVSYNPLGQPLWSSKTLEKIWQKGLVSIGEVSSSSCGYVARYSLKKRSKMSKTDEFVLMSRRPGIGAQFFIDHKDELYLSDKVYDPKFGSTKIPRYFDQLAENLDDVIVSYHYQRSKNNRVIKSKGYEYFNMIHFGVNHVEEAQVIEFANKLNRSHLLRRSL